MSSHPSGTLNRILTSLPAALTQPLTFLACSAALILISSTTVLRAAPQSSQAPPPAAGVTQAPPDNNTPQASRPALRVVQQMVQVDIIAKDHDGKPIQNLKQSDFTVYDNGK